MRLIHNCNYCNKQLIEVNRTSLLGAEGDYVEYKCGHAYVHAKTKSYNERELDFTSVDGTKSLRGYQEDGARFMLEGNLNSILSYQMRLGKTPTTLVTLREALKSGLDVTPCLILVRSANLYQWIREIRTWFDDSMLAVWPIPNSKTPILPGFKCYIVSMDSIRLDAIYNVLRELGIKCVIADEAHSFKNPSSSRSQSLVKLCTECNIPHHILLTGTPIKNRADEYFVPLNLVAPEQFPSLEKFRRNWLVSDDKGHYSRVAPYAMEAFKEKISPYVLRKEKEDVYNDLPLINRIFTVIPIEDNRLKKLYNAELDKMEAKVEMGLTGSKALMDNIMILRRICGMAKVPWLLDYMEVFGEENESDSAKLAIGIHHKGVRDTLYESMNGLSSNVLELSGEDNASQKDRIMRLFAEPRYKYLILNMLAGGVGMDFHYCHNVVVAERQWNSADEEQFEFRFYNPDREIMGDNNLQVEYVIADKTIDSFFYDLVEEKRSIFNDLVSNHVDIVNNPDNFKQLLERTLSSRL